MTPDAEPIDLDIPAEWKAAEPTLEPDPEPEPEPEPVEPEPEPEPVRSNVPRHRSHDGTPVVYRNGVKVRG